MIIGARHSPSLSGQARKLVGGDRMSGPLNAGPHRLSLSLFLHTHTRNIVNKYEKDCSFLSPSDHRRFDVRGLSAGALLRLSPKTGNDRAARLASRSLFFLASSSNCFGNVSLSTALDAGLAQLCLKLKAIDCAGR